MKQIISYWIFIITTFILISGWSSAHKIIELIVPTIADPRENAILSCKYDMEKDQLYSAKWFKNNLEIFRFMPAQKPPELKFPTDDVHLAKMPKCNRESCDLELTNISSKSAGVYRCEVSTEAPKFAVVYKNATMIVAALPLRDPLVEGAATSYSLGDDIRMNCTSDPSLPAAEVTWFINDRVAVYPEVDAGSESTTETGLSTKSLSLRLKSNKSLFVSRSPSGLTATDSNGLLRLRCVSVMPDWLPGGPHQRQYTITAKLRSEGYQNEKLLGNGCVTSCGRSRVLLMATLLMLLKATFHLKPRSLHY